MRTNWLVYIWILLCYPDAEQNPTNQSKEASLSLNTRNILKISDEVTTTTTATKTRSLKSIDRHLQHINGVLLQRVKRNERNEVPQRTLPRRLSFTCIGLLAITTKNNNNNEAPKTNTFRLVRLRAMYFFVDYSLSFFLSFSHTFAPSLRQKRKRYLKTSERNLQSLHADTQYIW